ncbi:oxidoreductase [Streptomyces inusitatus]|uniref:Oxidoreductase n=1 Tax=Streptomyces inusitatus TaxID=68221 RepID=A0A918UJA6_9ACTN|nr:aldo/keto reductase [Streptomyces inusitatus]GGZ14517.1 oxidoreductase [Streptomyces inusitatus]
MISAVRNPAGLSAIGFGVREPGGSGGRRPSSGEPAEAIRAALDGGVNWIDTAEVRGGGGLERIVGEVIAGRPGVGVCTRVDPERDDHLGGKGIRAALEESLTRLGRDRAEVALLHRPADDVPAGEAWEALIRLKAEGLVGAIGLAGFPAAEVKACAATGELDYLQVRASLLHRSELTLLGPLCERYDVGLLVAGPLAHGLLAGGPPPGAMDPGPEDFRRAGVHARYFAPGVLPGHERTVAALRAHAANTRQSLPRLALRWLLARGEVTCALVGAGTAGHAADSAAAAGPLLTADEFDEINAVLALAEDH